MEIPIENIVAASQKKWDAVIVGGGMGGGATAYSLALQGYKVLLIEKGFSNFSDTSAQGVEVEQENPTERLANGRWPTKLTTKVNRETSNSWMPLGCGVGGSTLLYAAALERLQPEDFAEQIMPNGQKISWPFSYQDLETYYQKAESLLSVCGTLDPLDRESTYQLGQPPEMCEIDKQIFQSLQSAGCHPYRLHVGIKYKEKCQECAGQICVKDCKQTSYNSFIIPAIKTGNLSVIDRAEVVKLEADKSTVKSLQVRQEGQLHTITGKVIILAAGAYFTPVLLQVSKNEFSPRGLGNDRDLVGRNLMFHTSDFLAVWHKGKLKNHKPRKTLAIRDFYHFQGHKLGQFQSIGLTADYGRILYFLRLKFDNSPWRKLRPLRSFLRIPAYVGIKVFDEASIFATIVEDFPYPENRVVYDEAAPSKMHLEYTVKEELKYRTKLLKKEIVKTLKSHLVMPLSEGVSLNYGHPCGTCRAGRDPESSVVDENCKVHSLDNLYIADASIMPTSGGTNPSLTVAANALRVAEAIGQKLQSLDMVAAP